MFKEKMNTGRLICVPNAKKCADNSICVKPDRVEVCSDRFYDYSS